MNKSKTIKLIIAGKDRVSKVLRGITGNLKKWSGGALKITGALVAVFCLSRNWRISPVELVS